jgi:hypothetical protein
MKLLLTTLIDVAEGHGLDEQTVAAKIMEHQRRYGAFGHFSTKNPTLHYTCTALELRNHVDIDPDDLPF